MGTHILGAMCLLAGGSERVSWIVGEVESDEKAAGDVDFAANVYLAFENGVRGFCRMLPSGPANWMIDAIGETGRIHVRNVDEGYEWELWRMGHAVEGGRATPVRHVFPRPQRIWSAGVGQVKDAIACIETGKTPNCSGELAVHLLEIAIAIRESHRRGNVRIDLPSPTARRSCAPPRPCTVTCPASSPAANGHHRQTCAPRLPAAKASATAAPYHNRSHSSLRRKPQSTSPAERGGGHRGRHSRASESPGRSIPRGPRLHLAPSIRSRR